MWEFLLSCIQFGCRPCYLIADSINKSRFVQILSLQSELSWFCLVFCLFLTSFFLPTTCCTSYSGLVLVPVKSLNLKATILSYIQAAIWTSQFGLVLLCMSRRPSGWLSPFLYYLPSCKAQQAAIMDRVFCFKWPQGLDCRLRGSTCPMFSPSCFVSFLVFNELLPTTTSAFPLLPSSCLPSLIQPCRLLLTKCLLQNLQCHL